MFQPRKVKHRKWQKGRSRNRAKETRATELDFGSIGLKALSNAWITSAQLEAARRVLVRYLRKEGKMWIRIFPDKPVTKKPSEVKMGGGKGDVDHYVAVVRAGRIIFELDGLDKKKAREALRQVAFKLPVKTKIITRD